MPFFVVLTKEKQPAYQLVSLSEDIRNGINFIARGEDLLASTAAQIWLSQKIKGAQQFSGAVFLHHELLKDENGKKLSKSEGASSLKNLRENGFPASELYREFSENLGIKECGSASEMLDFLKGETP
jgi:glutamyl-tRNA synthetase